jgi:hypothetical protein
MSYRRNIIKCSLAFRPAIANRPDGVCLDRLDDAGMLIGYEQVHIVHVDESRNIFLSVEVTVNVVSNTAHALLGLMRRRDNT